MSNRSSKTSDDLLSEEVVKLTADEIVDVIATFIPGIDIAYKLTKVYMGRGMKLREHRVLEWVEYVRDNIGEFSKELFDNEQFQDCFVILTESYVKERAKRKRELHQRILLGLTKLSEGVLEKFQLEKFIETTSNISFEGLNVLSFIKMELLDLIELDIKEQFEKYHEREGVEAIRLEEITRNRIIVSEYISHWIHERYNSNSELVKKKYGLKNSDDKEIRKKIAYEEHLKQTELMYPLHELSNLGLLIKREGTPTFGGTVGSGYSISRFGYEYMEYLENN